MVGASWSEKGHLSSNQSPAHMHLSASAMAKIKGGAERICMGELSVCAVKPPNNPIDTWENWGSEGVNSVSLGRTARLVGDSVFKFTVSLDTIPNSYILLDRLLLLQTRYKLEPLRRGELRCQTLMIARGEELDICETKNKKSPVENLL